MDKATMPLIAFTSDAVSRLTGLSIRQIHYWDRTGFFAPEFADPNRRRPHGRVYSFVDLVGLRTISKLLDEHVTWPDLKRVRSLFRSKSNVEWAKRTFYVIEGKVYFTHEEALVAARPLGQSADPIILELGPIVDDLQRQVEALSVRTSDEIGHVTRDRLIMNGKDVIAGTRIPTSTIDWFYRNGYSHSEIKKEFPRLTHADLQAALDHEAKRRERDPRHAAG